jgi:large subunit ribosomal protein L23
MKQILLSPIVTEKSMGINPDGKYIFEVNKKSNKHEVSNAVSTTYKVKVESVNIINVSGKKKNFRGKSSGRTKNYKKAIVTLVKNQKIPDFEVKSK